MTPARLDPARLPDANGHFGRFGGRFVPETLMSPLIELERAFRAAWRDARFRRRLAELLSSYAGRPTPLYFAERLTRHAGGARIYLKREDLCHTGAHKINNVLGQALLAVRMGKKRVIAETGRASTASPPPPPPRCSASTARCTWVRSTSSARRSTSSA